MFPSSAQRGAPTATARRRSRGTRARRALAGAALAAAVAAPAVLSAQPVAASPIEGHTGWSVLLCKYSDVPAETHPRSWYQNFATEAGRGMGGLADYFADQSQGRIDLRGSVVQGWYTMSVTKAQSQAAGKTRDGRIQDCVNAASAGGYTVPAGNRTIAITNDWVDGGAAGTRVLLDPGSINVGFAAHEMLHGYDLGHSFSNDTSYQNATWSQPGEYDDPYDEQSAMAHFSFNTANFGTSAVGLNGYHRDKLGWLNMDRVVTFGANGVGSSTINLSPLEEPATTGPQLIRIPFDAADLNHYYTVEYRRRTGWSAGIPADTVLLHEVKGGTPYLLRRLDGTRAIQQSLNANGATVTINSIGTRASVTVTSDIVDRCVQGYVWREARPTDRVCVTPAQRTQTRADNSAAASRWVNGAYGPHTCISGYVWREAFSGDDVCVTTAQRTQAANDNAAAASRRNPARLVWGPNQCSSGYVWREADRADWVCVTPAQRSQVAADNSARSSRWVNGAYGPHTCISGYVWREAFPADDVCVTTAQRTAIADQNRAARSHVAVPNG